MVTVTTVGRLEMTIRSDTHIANQAHTHTDRLGRIVE